MPAPYLLLPPSEGKTEGGRPPTRAGQFDEVLAAPRAEVLAGLARLLGTGRRADLERVFKARGTLCERALLATEELLAGRAPVLPAWRRYSGVVWGGLDAATLTAAQRRTLLIPSGLYGVTTGADPVADYRLTLLVSLPGVGPLASFWRTPLSEALAARVGRRTVVDLLPAEHAAAVDRARLAERARLVQVRFVDAAGSRAVGHLAKEAKGRLARHLLDEGLEAAPAFRWQGWRVRAEGDDLEVVAPRPRRGSVS